MNLQACKADEPDAGWEMEEKEAPKGPRVVIIGAGLAGLTAADRLARSGVTNLIVLEADCR